jgi:hypothetical protein
VILIAAIDDARHNVAAVVNARLILFVSQSVRPRKPLIWNNRALTATPAWLLGARAQQPAKIARMGLLAGTALGHAVR